MPLSEMALRVEDIEMKRNHLQEQSQYMKKVCDSPTLFEGWVRMR
jgi:hypothetical protein